MGLISRYEVSPSGLVAHRPILLCLIVLKLITEQTFFFDHKLKKFKRMIDYVLLCNPAFE